LTGSLIELYLTLPAPKPWVFGIDHEHIELMETCAMTETWSPVGTEMAES